MHAETKGAGWDPTALRCPRRGRLRWLLGLLPGQAWRLELRAAQQHVRSAQLATAWVQCIHSGLLPSWLIQLICVVERS